MEKDCEKLFARLDYFKPPRHILTAVMARIESARKRRNGFRLAVFGLSGLVSAAVFVPATRYLITDFYQTGFYQYLSVIFSDGGSALAYWKDFTLLLADSFPATAAAIVLISLFTMLGSIKALVRGSRPLFFQTKNG